LYLPRGDWYDYWTNERQSGGRTITRNVDLATIPLYVRAGACIPTGPVRQYTAETVDEPLTITVFPGADGHAFLYQDDGETFNFRKGEFTRVEMRWEDRSRHLTLRLAAGSRRLPSQGISFKVGMAGSGHWKSVALRGDSLSVVL
jgi:alpha-glucosidase (family GH31 glycosyl hydrolase)